MVSAVLLVGAALPIVLAGGKVPEVLRGEPRGAIISFLVAALWNFRRSCI
jgi:hypothetical protein